VFSGGRALTLGLIDGIGELRGVIRQRFGEDIALREIEPSRRRFGLSRLLRPRQGDFGTVIGDLAAWLEERLIWARFGL
jgi:ClpP class serine protease